MIEKFDIIINATSLGLSSKEDFNFDLNNVSNSSIFIDTIYNPLETNAIKKLKKRILKHLTVLICLSIKVKNLSIFGQNRTQKLMKNYWAY